MTPTLPRFASATASSSTGTATTTGGARTIARRTFVVSAACRVDVSATCSAGRTTWIADMCTVTATVAQPFRTEVAGAVETGLGERRAQTLGTTAGRFRR